MYLPTLFFTLPAMLELYEPRTSVTMCIMMLLCLVEIPWPNGLSGV